MRPRLPLGALPGKSGSSYACELARRPSGTACLQCTLQEGPSSVVLESKFAAAEGHTVLTAARVTLEASSTASSF